jgi:hypothetical protein
VISGNTGNGVLITGSDSTGNHVFGNYIGTNASGDTALANDQDGVKIDDESSSNIVGTDGDGSDDDGEGVPTQ